MEFVQDIYGPWDVLLPSLDPWGTISGEKNRFYARKIILICYVISNFCPEFLRRFIYSGEISCIYQMAPGLFFNPFVNIDKTGLGSISPPDLDMVLISFNIYRCYRSLLSSFLDPFCFEVFDAVAS